MSLWSPRFGFGVVSNSVELVVFSRVFLRKPARCVVDNFLDSQRRCDLTYDQVGCTQGVAIDGFDCDQYRVRLGRGDTVFAAAREAIAGWRMFPVWTQVVHDHGIRNDETIAVLIKACGIWWLNSTRIVYVIDDVDRQFGFAYGTLPGHVESGEERFLVHRDEDDVVWYDLRAISRPRHWVTRVGYPLVRMQQRRFARDSQLAMVEATSHALLSH